MIEGARLRLARGLLIPAIAGTVTATIIGGVLVAGLMIGLSLLLTPKDPGARSEEHEKSYAFPARRTSPARAWPCR